MDPNATVRLAFDAGLDGKADEGEVAGPKTLVAAGGQHADIAPELANESDF